MNDLGARPSEPVSRSIYAELLDNAWPLVTAMAGEILLGLVDTKLVTGLGTDALAGVGIATTLMWVCYALAMGLSRGVKVRVAFAVGEGRSGDASTYGAAGAIIAFAYGLVVFALGRDIGPLLVALGTSSRRSPLGPPVHAPPWHWCNTAKASAMPEPPCS
jgi:Na+-driven multidrug efflux pump